MKGSIVGLWGGSKNPANLLTQQSGEKKEKGRGEAPCFCQTKREGKLAERKEGKNLEGAEVKNSSSPSKRIFWGRSFFKESGGKTKATGSV